MDRVRSACKHPQWESDYKEPEELEPESEESEELEPESEELEQESKELEPESGESDVHVVRVPRGFRQTLRGRLERHVL